MQAPCTTCLVLLALAACTQPPPPPPGPQQVVLCYQTLAWSWCYDRPDHGREEQLLGGYFRPDPEPGSKSWFLALAEAQEAASSLGIGPPADMPLP